MKLKSAFLTAAVLGSISVASAQLFNEFDPNPPGSDPTDSTFELSGTASSSFSGFILSLETDITSGSGLTDRIYAVSGNFDANGLLVFTGPDLENPSFTLLLVDNFTGDTSTDFDTDNDGVVDLDLSSVGITTVFDSINVSDQIEDDGVGYADDFGGTSLINAGFEPEVAFRDSISGLWYQSAFGTNLFDANGIDASGETWVGDPYNTSFGALNPNIDAVPEPATMAVFGLAIAAIARKRRNK